MQYPEKLLHGVDYYPDQWIGHPEVLAEDLRLMKEAKISAVTLGVFAWSSLEPRDGVRLLYGDRGTAYYLACRTDDDLLAAFLGDALAEAGIMQKYSNDYLRLPPSPPISFKAAL